MLFRRLPAASRGRFHARGGLILSVALLLGAPVLRAGPEFGILLGRPTDAVEKTVETRNSLEVRIKSPGGIGTAELRLPDGRRQWPRSMIFFIRLAEGKPLQELEGFSLRGERVAVSGSRKTSGRMAALDLGPGGKAPDEKRKPREVDIRIEKTAAAMMIVIPGSLLAGESRVTLQWIDYYR